MIEFAIGQTAGLAQDVAILAHRYGSTGHVRNLQGARLNIPQKFKGILRHLLLDDGINLLANANQNLRNALLRDAEMLRDALLRPPVNGVTTPYFPVASLNLKSTRHRHTLLLVDLLPPDNSRLVK